MPTLEKLHKEWSTKGFLLLGIGDEEADLLRGFYKKNGLTFTTLLDPSREVREHYGVQGIPSGVLLDRKGRIASQFGGTQSERTLRARLRRAGLK